MEWIYEYAQPLQDYITTALYLLTILVLTWIFSKVGLYTTERWLTNHNWVPQKIDPKKYFRYPVRYLLLSIFLHLFSPLIELPERLSHIFLHAVEILAIFSTTLFVLSVAEYSKRILFDRFEISENGHFKQRKTRTQLQFVYRIGTGFVLLIAIAAVLMSFESARKFGTSIIASAGVASIVIGFAAQKSIGNIIAGFQIAFTQPLRLDDIIFVENDWGTVEEISLSYVVVRYWDNRRLILPITYFIDRPFQNWTRNSTDIAGTIVFYVDYATPVDALRAEAEKQLVACPLWDRRVFELTVNSFTDRCMEIRIDMSSTNAKDLSNLRAHMREKMIDFMQRNYGRLLPMQRSFVVSKNDATS